MDIVFIAVIAAFAALTWGMAHACAQLEART